MNKNDTIIKFAEKTSRTKAESEKILNEIIEFVSEELVSGETIKLSGFMELGTKIRNERMGTNPKTKEKILIPSQRVPYVKFGKTLKNCVK